MAWNEEIIPLVRGLINDISHPTYTYSDDQVTEFIIYAAHFVNQEVSFDTTYTIDISATTISPDPSTPTRDVSFINLIALKAAILILNGEVKVAAGQAVKVVDGPSSLDFTMVYKAKKELLEQMKNEYDKMKLSVNLGELSSWTSVLSPYTQEVVFSDYYR